jgi:hypothetical protein
MALLFCDGFDSYSAVADMVTRGYVGAVGSITPNSYVSVNANAGAYGGGCVVYGPGDYNSAIQMPSIFTYTEGMTLNFGMLFKQIGVPSVNFPSSTGNASAVINLGYDAAVSGLCDTAPILWPTTTGVLQFCGHMLSPLAGGLGKINVCDGVWHWMEVQVVFAQTAVGAVAIYIDGRLDIQMTGIPTKSSSRPLFGHVGFGAGANNGSLNCTTYYDDFMVWDNTGTAFNTFPIGQKRIYSGDPNGAGNSSQFTPLSGSNYAAASQSWNAAGAGTNSLTAVAASQTDLYLVNALKGATPSQIDALVVNASANNPGAGVRSLINAASSGGIVVPGRTNQLLSTLKTFQQPFYQDSSSRAWTPTSINSVQIGAASA